MVVTIAITILCGVGLYASLFMLRKSQQAERGLVKGPSVVKTPRANLFAGIPNSLLGSLYYPLLVLAAWLPLSRAAEFCVLFFVASAAAVSFYLAYSLLFVTRRWCPYCWTSHAANWSLLILWVLRVTYLRT